MINYYQPWLLPFLQLPENRLPPGVKMYYYHSFEDGLWVLLRQKFPHRKKLRILIPDFYCSDVLDNLRSSGHTYMYYPLDNHFQINPAYFSRYLWMYRPDVVVIFNACGIRSRLLKDTSWLSDFPQKSLVVEDCVHSLIDPSRFTFINDRHVLMDSLRKVSPLPGSRLFAPIAFLSFPQAQSSWLSTYRIASVFWYVLFRLVLLLGFLISSSRLIAFSHEWILRHHDDLVGDSPDPHAGFSWLLPLVNRFHYSHIRTVKRCQSVWYDKHLQEVFSKPFFYQVAIPESDRGELHVYPLGTTGPPDEGLIKWLHKNRIPVWYKFTDTPWSQNRGVLFLPLGFHMSEAKIKHLSHVLFSYVKDYHPEHLSPLSS